MSIRQVHLLQTRRFLPLFVTQFLGAFNDNMVKNAFVILITYRLAEIMGLNAQILVTLVAGLYILPFFLFSATAGQLADKYEKSHLICLIKLAEVLIMLLAALGFYLQSIAMLMTVLFALGVHAAFFGPLKYAILPDQLHEDELLAGNGLIEAGTFIAILIGTIAGGVLILRAHGSLVVSMIGLFAALVGWFSSYFVPVTSVNNPGLCLSFNFVRATYNNLCYARQQKAVFLAILGISWFWLVGATFLAELAVFAKDILHANQSVVTFFLTLFSVGLAIGSLLCNSLLQGRVHTKYVPMAALGLMLLTLDLCWAASTAITSTGNLIGLSVFLHTFQGWRITLDLLILAICGGVYTVPLYALMLQRSEKAHRACVIGSNNIMNALFMVLSAMMTLLMLKGGFSVTDVFLIVGLGNGAVALYLSKLRA